MTDHSAAPPSPLFEAFFLEVDNLLANWTIWERLFGGQDTDRSEEHALTKEASSGFFLHARWSMLRAALLDLGRLCGDRLESCGRPNLTMQRVWEEAQVHLKGKKSTYLDASIASHGARMFVCVLKWPRDEDSAFRWFS